MLSLSDYPWIRTTPNVWMILRLSQEDKEEPDALAKHRSLLTRLARQDGVDLVSCRFVEEIESGDTIAARPRFSAALAEWERLPYGVGGLVYSTEVARLTRGLQSDQGRVQDAMRRARLLHRTPARWFDLRLPDDATAWELDGFLARLELRTFRWRMQMAFDERLRQGRLRNGHVPFGYALDPATGEPVPDPARFPVLVSWCREVLTVSTGRLAAAAGVSQTVVHQTLTNPAICGWPARRSGLHRGARLGWKTKVHRLPREEWEWPEEEGRYPKACTLAEWEAIQAALAARYRGRTKTGHSSEGWCVDRVVFPQLPGPVKLSSRPAGGGYLTYERYQPGGPKLYIARDVVHAAAEAALRRLCSEPALLVAGLAAARQEWEEERERRTVGAGSAARARAAALAAARSALDGVTRLLVEAHDPEERASLLRVRGEKLGAVRALKAEGERAAASLPGPLLPDPGFLAGIAGAFDFVWSETPGEARRALVNACLAAIPVEVDVGLPRVYWARRVLPVVEQPWIERCRLARGGE